MITFSRLSKIVFLAVFVFVNLFSAGEGLTREMPAVLNVPVQGNALILKGMNILPNEPLQLNFIFGNTNGAGVDAYERQVHYFMAGLTIPASDLWVNLSPVESDRITSESLRQTKMGSELLSQDYQLKKAVSEFLNPLNEKGKAIWEEFYQALYQAYGSADVPIDALNKIWIVPGDADIVVDGNTVVIARSSLKVMLEEDYLNGRKTNLLPSDVAGKADRPQFIKEILRKHLLPLIENEVNASDRFEPLRQIYHALLLAEWYKHNIHNRILNQSYVNKNLIGGIDFDARKEIDQIFKSYCEHFQRQDSAQIQESYDPSTQSVIPRQYVTGGFQWEASFEARVQRHQASEFLRGDDQFLSLALIPEESDNFAMLVRDTNHDTLSIDDAIDKIYDFYEGKYRARSIEEILFSIYRYDDFLFTAEEAEEIAKTERLPYVIYFLETLMRTEKYDNGYRANGYDPYLFSGSQILSLFRMNPDLKEFDRLLQPFRDEGIISANVIFKKILKQLSVKQAPKEKSIETRAMDLRKFLKSSHELEKNKRARAVQKHLLAMHGKAGALVNQRTKVLIGNSRKLAGRLLIIPELVSLENEKFIWTTASFSYVFLSPRSNHDVVRLARFLAEQGFSADKTGTII